MLAAPETTTTTTTGPAIRGTDRATRRARDATAIDPLSDVHTAVKSATGTKIIALIDVSSRFALPIAQAAKEVRASEISRARRARRTRRATRRERLTREWVDAETAGCVRDGAQVDVSRVRHHAMAVSKDAKTEHYD